MIGSMNSLNTNGFNIQNSHKTDSEENKNFSNTKTDNESKSISMTWDTVSLSQNALDLAKEQQSTLISIMENASTGLTPAERSADGRRAAQSMRSEFEADDIKRGTLVIEDNQEAMEQDIEEAKAEREEANSENSSSDNATNTEGTASSANTSSSSSSKSSQSSASSESGDNSSPSE